MNSPNLALARQRIADCLHRDAQGRLVQRHDHLNLANLNLTNAQLEGHFTATERNLGDLSLASLPHLRYLDLTGNQLTELPECLAACTGLKWLGLNFNQLQQLPESLGALTRLERLYLRGNALTTLPEALGRLTQLRELDLTSNQLAALPESMRKLPELEALYLHENPALGLPAEVLRSARQDVSGERSALATPAAILEYFFSIAGKKGRALREVKLVLVGRGEVGKSTMAGVLRGLPFTKDHQRTDGIAITPWEVGLTDGAAKVLLWDFGGQEILHGTHQFFLTHRSLYVVMVDGRHDRAKQDAEYWLKLVRAFGGESPVLVVMNRQQAHPFDMDRQFLADKHGVKLEHFFRTDCERKTDIEPLRAAIFAAAERMLATEEKFPKEHWAVKERLEEMKDKGEDYLSEGRYAELCTAHGEPDPTKQANLLRRLADLGTVVSFPDDVKLAEFSVLNPEWATDGIYRVVTNEALREKKHGLLDRASLRNLLPKERWPQPKHLQYIIELMKKFELCFPVGEDDTAVLVPELLPDKTPPLADWKPEECVVFLYRYPVLPHGVLPRFITRTHELSKGKERWRTGVVLEDDGAEALVKADYDANTVSVWVRGKHADSRRALLKVVRHHFELIHSRIKDLKPIELVALKGHPEVLESYAALVKDERRGKPTVAVTLGEERADVPIADFLDGIGTPHERTQADDPRSEAHFHTHHHHHETEITTMSHNVSVGGSNYGQAGGQGNAQTITDSFQAIQGIHGEALAALFKQLHERIAPLKDELKGKDIKALDEHSAKLIAEAEKPKEQQDRQALSLSAKGVIEAANTVGKIAGPVIATTKAILQAFGIPLP